MFSRLIATLIPAAGASSRMGGRDKLLEDVDGTPLLARLVAAALPHGAVYVALPALDHPRHAVLPPPTNVVVVEDWQTGMSASLKCGVAAIPEGVDILILPGDMPEIGTDDIAALVQARDTDPDALIWQATTEDGTPGHPVLFHADLQPAFAALTGDQGARRILKRNEDRLALVPLAGHRARVDLDTPEDWARWRAKQ